MSDEISISLCQAGADDCTTRMKQEFMASISDQVEAGALSAKFSQGVLTLSSEDLDLLGDAEEKAQNMLGYVVL